ncbi:hypothetical protein SVIO_035970 [Streptomyces violaceusniger]|uniref:Transketolase-like C-terminal domain-containing protein n=1 Tax=Streptomyces violaceusniger TaxID=68280 RepID=A0A4D4KXS7_STRVO|nr:hypothetical protein SVIO_035970 [Streptomyces violaceusniger]
MAADVWSATSWSELRRDALSCDAAQLKGEDRVPYVTRALAGAPGPVLAVSDWMRAVPDQISQWVEQDWYSLGTDGFGLSDTREAARRHFGVDAPAIVVAALSRLARQGAVRATAPRRPRSATASDGAGAGDRLRRAVPLPAPSHNWGSAPDPAPQSPEGLISARQGHLPAVAGEIEDTPEGRPGPGRSPCHAAEPHIDAAGRGGAGKEPPGRA